jgi:hypothetical protein
MKISLTVHFFKVREQGDQFGRFFAYVKYIYTYFGQFVLENSISTSNLVGFLFFHGKSYVLLLTKNGSCCILGDFFTNSSGHPVREKRLGIPHGRTM